MLKFKRHPHGQCSNKQKNPKTDRCWSWWKLEFLTRLFLLGSLWARRLCGAECPASADGRSATKTTAPRSVAGGGVCTACMPLSKHLRSNVWTIWCFNLQHLRSTLWCTEADYQLPTSSSCSTAWCHNSCQLALLAMLRPLRAGRPKWLPDLLLAGALLKAGA